MFSPLPALLRGEVQESARNAGVARLRQMA
jgi:hypothetical protein